jgi:hypothetical protein
MTIFTTPQPDSSQSRVDWRALNNGFSMPYKWVDDWFRTMNPDDVVRYFMVATSTAAVRSGERIKTAEEMRDFIARFFIGKANAVLGNTDRLNVYDIKRHAFLFALSLRHPLDEILDLSRDELQVLFRYAVTAPRASLADLRGFRDEAIDMDILASMYSGSVGS